MNRKHDVVISVATRSGDKQEVTRSRRVRLPRRLLTFLFGDFCEVFVLTPGAAVKNVVIHELRDDDETQT